MSNKNAKEELIKKLWKKLSENSSMDIMREILHEELKDTQWHKDNDREIGKVVDSLNSKSYEEISSELCDDKNKAHDLDDLMLILVNQRKDTVSEEVKQKIFERWSEAYRKPQQKKSV